MAAAARTSPLMTLLRQAKTIAWLLVATPLFTFTIWLEGLLAPFFSLRFPRDEAEARANPGKLVGLLTETGALPQGAVLVSLKPLAKIESEPDKNATVTILRLTYRAPETAGRKTDTRHLDLFLKFQCSRGLPLLLQGFRAAAEFGIQREVDFYNRLSRQTEVCPLQCPRVLYAGAAHAFNRVCIVLEYINGGQTIRDHDGCPEGHMQAMMTAAAEMHAYHWGTVHRTACTNWIPAARSDLGGMEYVSWVKLLIGKEPKWYQDVFNSVISRLDDTPKTLLHGDCRPGNMQFIMSSTGSDASDHDVPNGHSSRVTRSKTVRQQQPVRLDRVIFTDFEATNVGPALWDFTYCCILGQNPESRRATEAKLLKSYTSSLLRAGSNIRDVRGATGDGGDNVLRWSDGSPVSEQECETQYRLLSIVLFVLGTAIVRGGQWDKQGNTREDGEAWFVRISTAVLDLSPALLHSELGLNSETIAMLQQRAQQQVDEVLNPPTAQ